VPIKALKQDPHLEMRTRGAGRNFEIQNSDFGLVPPWPAVWILRSRTLPVLLNLEEMRPLLRVGRD
jgi:hypothetical protein